MHKDFPDWYRVVSIQPTTELLDKRWMAVQKIAASTRRAAVLDLLRLVVRSPALDPEIGNGVSEVARSVDPTFSVRDSAVETRVLAGAALVEMLQKPTSVADVVALGMTSASFLASRDELCRTFQGHATQYLAGETLRVRKSSKVALDAKALLDTFRTAIAAATSPPSIAEPTATLVSSVADLVATAVHKSLSAELIALREESNMFWWAFTASSRDLARSFRGGGAWISLVAGKELADLTEMIPGPRSAPALLEHVIRGAPSKGTATVTVSSAINGAPRTWRDIWKKNYSPADTRELTPLLVGVDRALQTDSETDWISAFEKAVGISDIKVDRAVLAVQAYIESTFVRAASELAK
jgi:hypothetical protein